MEQVVALIVAHQWVPLLALIVGAIVRLLKSDTKLPIDIPARARPWVALALAAVGAVLEQVVAGVSWQEAITGALVAAFTAMAGHDVIIESLRGGRELPVPGLMRKPANDTGGISNAAVLVLAIGLAYLSTGCAGSLEKWRGPSATIGASPKLSAHCRKLDTKVRRSTIALGVGTALAGGAALPPLLTDNSTALYTAAGVGLAGGVIGAVAYPIRQSNLEAWTRDCAK